jgi:hypothetical protein
MKSACLTCNSARKNRNSSKNQTGQGLGLYWKNSKNRKNRVGKGRDGSNFPVFPKFLVKAEPLHSKVFPDFPVFPRANTKRKEPARDTLSRRKPATARIFENEAELTPFTGVKTG